MKKRNQPLKETAIFSYSDSSNGQSDRFQPQGKDTSDPVRQSLHLGIKWQSTDVKELENL